MSGEFWFGLALAVPIGIGGSLVANLLTPRMNAWAASRSAGRRAKLEAQQERARRQAVVDSNQPWVFAIWATINSYTTIGMLIAATASSGLALAAVAFADLSAWEEIGVVSIALFTWTVGNAIGLNEALSLKRRFREMIKLIAPPADDAEGS